MNDSELITMYEHVAQITATMLTAARQGDWDLLAQLENDCSSRVATIRGCEIPKNLPPELRSKKITIINKILADDREIRNLTEPWMAELSKLLRNSNTAIKLSRTYSV